MRRERKKGFEREEEARGDGDGEREWVGWLIGGMVDGLLVVVVWRSGIPSLILSTARRL